MEIKIAPVTPAEVPLLLGLIRELAEFEKLEHEVTATPELFTEALFGSRPAAGALLARCDDEVVGYAIYYFTFSTFLGRAGIWLEDLYVRPLFRKRGLGRQLMEAVAQVGVERDCGRYEWMALDWNENALDVYRRLGAREMSEWVLLRMNRAQLQQMGAKKS
ncbi:MAG TPA: GNAT family N-acetyltransferase [Verrucomicrobiae bacterium]|jgi:GNAT superfamily N-acetyltransferase|nr:GNAT family N-acetyltransferase [Verrucomicrobiae bacterium]